VQWPAFTTLFLLALFGAAPSIAHEARPLFVEISESGGGTYTVHWRVPPVVSERNTPTIDLPICDRASPVREISGSRGIVGTRTYHCPDGLNNVSLAITYPEFNPAISTLVRLVRVDGASVSLLASPENTDISLISVNAGGNLARDYTYLGIKHILLGYDHLLFIGCLLLLAGTARRIFLAVTGFTVAHSITLAAMVLGLVNVPTAAVEAAIALSIVFLAVEIARGRRNTLAWRYPVSVAASFGLLHGLGFASVLMDAGLPPNEVPAALLFFNVGVELGQLAFILTLLCVLVVVRQLGLPRRPGEGIAGLPAPFATGAAYLAGTLAAFWFIERLSGF